MTGDFEFRSVHIDPGVVDPADVTMLEDLVLAALRDAVARVGESQEPALDLGSLDLGSLGDFLGGD